MLPKDIEDFIGAAKRVSLGNEAMADVRQNLMDAVAVQSHPLIASAAALSLSKDEKVAMKADLLLFMERHHARTQDAQQSSVPFWSVFSFLLRLPVAACFVLLIGASGVAYASQSALPGTALYPLKIHMLEAVATTLAQSPKAQAQLQADLALERLREAQELLSRGALSAPASEAVNENFTKHVRAMRGQLRELNDQKEFAAVQEIESRFARRAAERADGLATTARGASDAQGVTRRLLPTVEVAVLQSLQAEADLELSNASGSDDADTDHLSEAAAKRVSTVRSYIRDHRGSLKSKVRQKVNAKLEDADADLTKAANKLEKRTVTERAGLVKKGLRAAEDAANALLLDEEDGDETVDDPRGQSSSRSSATSSKDTSSSSRGVTSSSAGTSASESMVDDLVPDSAKKIKKPMP